MERWSGGIPEARRGSYPGERFAMYPDRVYVAMQMQIIGERLRLRYLNRDFN